MGRARLGSKLGRTASHRSLMLKNMVTSLLKYETIHTTTVKAQELKKMADKMITLGKRGDMHARRQAAAYIREREMVGKLFGELSERYKDRQGGYTRLVHSGNRVGDNAPMSIIELVSSKKRDKAAKKKSAAKEE